MGSSTDYSSPDWTERLITVLGTEDVHLAADYRLSVVSTVAAAVGSYWLTKLEFVWRGRSKFFMLLSCSCLV